MWNSRPRLFFTGAPCPPYISSASSTFLLVPKLLLGNPLGCKALLCSNLGMDTPHHGCTRLCASLRYQHTGRVRTTGGGRFCGRRTPPLPLPAFRPLSPPREARN